MDPPTLKPRSRNTDRGEARQNVRTLQMHIVALQALVMGVLVQMAMRDPEGLREILDDPSIMDPESLPELAHLPARDRRQMKETLEASPGHSGRLYRHLPPPQAGRAGAEEAPLRHHVRARTLSAAISG